MGLAEYAIIAQDDEWGILHDGSIANRYSNKQAAFESGRVMRSAYRFQVRKPASGTLWATRTMGRTSDAMAVQQQGSTARRIFDLCFRNRQTGAITVAQAPNLTLWIVIATGALRWIWPSGTPGVLLTVGFKGGLAIWAADEIFRGVNPWRRCLGVAVLIYDLATIW